LQKCGGNTWTFPCLIHFVTSTISPHVGFVLTSRVIGPGVRKLMFEVVKKQSVERKAGVSALLYYTMRGTSLKFHSKAERVLRILLDNSIFGIGDKFTEGKSFPLE